jgi:hypothetical protein
VVFRLFWSVFFQRTNKSQGVEARCSRREIPKTKTTQFGLKNTQNNLNPSLFFSWHGKTWSLQISFTAHQNWTRSKSKRPTTRYQNPTPTGSSDRFRSTSTFLYVSQSLFSSLFGWKEKENHKIRRLEIFHFVSK